MKVKIERIVKGTWLPRAKSVLARMVYVSQDACNTIVDDMSLRDIPITLVLRGPTHGADWDAFNRIFEFVQIPHGLSGTAKHFVDNDWNDDSDEEYETSMQLFCIKTESRQGNKYEILVLATTEEIALEHSVRDPAVVKSINIVPGPFTNGTVLSTKLIT